MLPQESNSPSWCFRYGRCRMQWLEIGACGMPAVASIPDMESESSPQIHHQNSLHRTSKSGCRWSRSATTNDGNITCYIYTEPKSKLLYLGTTITSFCHVSCIRIWQTSFEWLREGHRCLSLSNDMDNDLAATSCHKEARYDLQGDFLGFGDVLRYRLHNSTTSRPPFASLLFVVTLLLPELIKVLPPIQTSV